MATVQQAQFSDKDNAAIQKAFKEAQDIVANNDNAKARQEQVVMTAGVMMNAQSRLLTHSDTKEWKGHFLATPAKNIGGNAFGWFIHEGANWEGQLPVVVGSKAAIVYTTVDRMHPGLGYLLAWHKPENSTVPTKVYVEARNSARFAKINWEVIEAKLDASGNKSCYEDSETGAKACARIKDGHDTKVAFVGATFDRSITV